jgi:predicted transcriptional regulator with HTH domain
MMLKELTASALSHLIISILFYCPLLYPTDTYVSDITREKEGKNVPLTRNCAFAF